MGERIAVLSDVHGNAIALDAVLADARAVGAHHFWVLGDHVAIGPEPGRVMQTLRHLDNARFIRGNTDRYVVTGDLPASPLPAAEADPAAIPLYGNVVASFAWTRGYLTATGDLPWLEHLPLDFTTRCADGVRVHAVHAAPGTDDGEGIHPGLSNDQIAGLIRDTEADVVIVAHTHEPMVRRIGQRIVINLGSVSNPRAPDLRASYVLLDSTASGTTFTMRRVDYDRAAFEQSVLRSGHPAARYIMSFQRGEEAGRVPHPDHAPHVTDRAVLASLDAC